MAKGIGAKPALELPARGMAGREIRSPPSTSPGGAPRRGDPRRLGDQEPQHAPQGLQGLRRGRGRHKPPGAQARSGHGGRLGRHTHVAHQRGERGHQVSPVRGDPTLPAARPRRGYAGHEAGRLVHVPRARLGPLRRRGGQDLCDNLKTGAVSRPKGGEVVLSET